MSRLFFALVLVRRDPYELFPEHDEPLLFEVEGGAQEGLLLGVLLVRWVFEIEPLPPSVGEADLEADGEVGFGGRGHALGGDELLEQVEGEALDLGELLACRRFDLGWDDDTACQRVAFLVDAEFDYFELAADDVAAWPVFRVLDGGDDVAFLIALNGDLDVVGAGE